MAGNSNTPISLTNESMNTNTFHDTASTLSKALEKIVHLKANRSDRPDLALKLHPSLNKLFDKLIPQLIDNFSMFYHEQQSSEEFNTLSFLALKYLFVDSTLTPRRRPGGGTVVQADGSFIYDETCVLTDRTIGLEYLSLVKRSMTLYKELELNDLSEEIIHGINEWILINESSVKSSSKL